MSETSGPSDIAKKEEEILAFWSDQSIFDKTLEKPAPKGEFVFYEGPPTANGRPGIHHLETRAFKDAILRYKTMRGYRVPRRAGWDTHGLPVELEVEKELGFSGKKDIEAYGVAAFNTKCKESVLRYVEEAQTLPLWQCLSHQRTPGQARGTRGPFRIADTRELSCSLYRAVLLSHCVQKYAKGLPCRQD